MADGTINNYALETVKVAEATEGKGILVDPLTTDQFIQAFFTPKTKILGIDTGLTIGESLRMEYHGLDLSTIRGLLLFMFFPDYVPPPESVPELEIRTQLLLYYNDYLFYEQTEPSDLSHRNRPQAYYENHSFFITTLPMNDYTNQAKLLSFANKADLSITIENATTSNFLVDIVVVGSYTQIPESISLFYVDTSSGGSDY